MSAAARPLPSRNSTRRHNRHVWTAVSIMELMTTGAGIYPATSAASEKAPATMPGRGTGSIPLTSLIRPMPGRPLRDATT